MEWQLLFACKPGCELQLVESGFVAQISNLPWPHAGEDK
jgi:hypothetical protein